MDYYLNGKIIKLKTAIVVTQAHHPTKRRQYIVNQFGMWKMEESGWWFHPTSMSRHLKKRWRSSLVRDWSTAWN